MIHIEATEERFNQYPSMSEAHKIESIVPGISIDYGYYGSRGLMHKNLLNETEEESLNNPY